MLAPGTMLQQRYRIVEQIGKGGMGAVYLARDLRLSHDVAIKETFFQDETYRRAFEHEAKLLARLRHQALPKVSDHFSEGNGQFLVMEYIYGEDLGSQLTRLGKRFASPQALNMVLRWADQLLDVLNYLHNRPMPIIHRDLKPKNLKLTSTFDIILLDFGLARGGVTVTMDTTNTAGPEQRKIYGFTPPYAPIEQMRDGEPDPRSDIYSLGATLYHMLTDTLPPDAMSRMARLINGNNDPLRPIREISPHVPELVANLIHRSLSITMDGRPQNARIMREELFYARQGGISPSHISQPQTPSSSQAPPNYPPQNYPAQSYPPGHAFQPGMTIQPGMTVQHGNTLQGGQTYYGANPTLNLGSQPSNETPPVGTMLRMITTGSPIRTLTFSSDGELLAAGHDDKTISIWRMGDYTQLHTLRGHGSGIRSLFFSPKNDLLASGSDDETVRIWQTNTGESLRMLRMPGCAVEGIAFSPNGKLLAVGGWGSTITICTVDGDSIRILDTLPSPFVQSICFSADGELLAAGCFDGIVYLWNTSDHQPAGQLTGFASFIYSVAFSHNGEYITASSQSSIRLWRAAERKAVEIFEGHRNPVRSLAFSPDDQFLASASEDMTVRLWRMSDSTAAFTPFEHRAGVTSLAYRPDGRVLATGTHDGRIYFWQV
ncbi:WD40 repeat domain-containing serine/threonine protein kinase [Candidatus Oscillochloris fontis]|uniref:WD40 repeat domain-containing serine/threonine protein kinase n=1 Tax=Candidatus Oscillochloris fontis TaxID=2496868 RepID=UPI001EE8C81D|nr:serine/threonine-protein kinase [Candidatus Oscillochloris fontis]